MASGLNRAERYCELAEECRRLAATTLSTQMRSRYLQMAESYRTLAEAEATVHPSLRKLAASTARTSVAPDSRTARARPFVLHRGPGLSAR
jgi:hypothetical protein